MSPACDSSCLLCFGSQHAHPAPSQSHACSSFPSTAFLPEELQCSPSLGPVPGSGQKTAVNGRGSPVFPVLQSPTLPTLASPGFPTTSLWQRFAYHLASRFWPTTVDEDLSEELPQMPALCATSRHQGTFRDSASGDSRMPLAGGCAVSRQNGSARAARCGCEGTIRDSSSFGDNC